MPHYSLNSSGTESADPAGASPQTSVPTTLSDVGKRTNVLWNRRGSPKVADAPIFFAAALVIIIGMMSGAAAAILVAPRLDTPTLALVRPPESFTIDGRMALALKALPVPAPGDRPVVRVAPPVPIRPESPPVARTVRAKVVAPPAAVVPPVVPSATTETSDPADLVPGDMQSLFEHARQAFDAGRYAQAADETQEVTTKLGRPEFADSAAARSLGARASELRARAESLRADRTEVPDDVQNRVYTIDDRQVIAPVEVSRSLPAWVEHAQSKGIGTYQGLVEVVISNQGVVQSARIRRSITPAYDAALLALTRTWRFQPATLDGTPVAYRKSFEVIVHSR